MKKYILIGILVVELAIFALLLWPRLSNYIALSNRLAQIPQYGSSVTVQNGEEVFLTGVVHESSLPVFQQLVAFNDMAHFKSSIYHLRDFYTTDSLIVQVEDRLARINIDHLIFEVKVNSLETKSQKELNKYRQGEKTFDHYYGISIGDTVTFHGFIKQTDPLILESASIVQLGQPDDLFWDFANSDDHHSMSALVFSGWLFVGGIALLAVWLNDDIK